MLMPIIGKYREVIFAIILFIIIDLSVLILNYYTSFSLSQDAIAINLAGRQRMLSQKMTKEILAIEVARVENQSIDEFIKNLETTSTLFNTALTAFDKGGEVMGTAGKPVRLSAIIDQEARGYITEGLAIWQKIYNPLQFLFDNSQDIESLFLVKSHLLANNLALLETMNALTTRLEQLANNRASFVRTVQTIGIVLIILNFFVILFHFLSRLQKSDSALLRSQQENQEILDTVGDGLFLLNAEGKIADQYSKALLNMLERTSTQDQFLKILEPIVTPGTLKTVSDYIEVLFNEEVEESLVHELNPLDEVIIYPGQTIEKILKFQFKRVISNQAILHLLVTVQDITEKVHLQKALSRSQQSADTEMFMLVQLLKVNPTQFNIFMNNTEKKLMYINTILKDIKLVNYQRYLQVIFRDMHAIKGEAALLELNFFAEAAHDFEIEANALRENNVTTGEQFLPLTIKLNEMFRRMDMVREVLRKIQDFQKQDTNKTLKAEDLVQDLNKLGQRLAHSLEKSVNLHLDINLINDLSPDIQRVLRDIIVQMARNSIVHGIENPKKRTILGKQAQGNIHISLKLEAENLLLTIVDDGQGLSIDKIRKKLLETQKISKEQLSDFSEKQLIGKIFISGFSTAEQTDQHAGHGIGLDLVMQKIQSLGGQLNVNNREGKGLSFRIRLPLTIEENTNNVVSAMRVA